MLTFTIAICINWPWEKKKKIEEWNQMKLKEEILARAFLEDVPICTLRFSSLDTLLPAISMTVHCHQLFPCVFSWKWFQSNSYTALDVFSIWLVLLFVFSCCCLFGVLGFCGSGFVVVCLFSPAHLEIIFVLYFWLLVADKLRIQQVGNFWVIKGSD